MGIRRALSWILAKLSVLAIKKHGMVLIVVSGRTGTKLTAELIGEMLSPEYVVRKQLERPGWDYSIPLTILGVDDRRYRWWQWIPLLLMTMFRLLLGRRNKTWTILQVNSYHREIAEYWIRIVSPDVLVLTGEEGRLRNVEELMISKTKGMIVSLDGVITKKHLPEKTTVQLKTVGFSPRTDVYVRGMWETDNGIEMDVTYKGSSKKRKYAVFQKGAFMKIPLMLSVATLLSLDFDEREVTDKLLQAQIDLDRFIYTAHT